jgi:hypothetical protein
VAGASVGGALHEDRHWRYQKGKWGRHFHRDKSGLSKMVLYTNKMTPSGFTIRLLFAMVVI